MSVNAATLSAGRALDVLRAGWAAQAAGQLTASWMLHGRPGVGKTQIIAQLAQEIGARLYDLRLTTLEPQDLRGLPFYDHDSRTTRWYPPEDLPADPDHPAVLFLDELTAAAPALQPTVYGLLQERRVGPYRLPDPVFVVAAGNQAEDGAVAYEMGTALSDRLVHLVVRAEAADWIAGFAVPRGLHPAVTAFVRTRPDLLDTTDDALRRGQVIACTPRSWERASRIVQAVPDRSLRGAMLAGVLGEAVAAEFTLVAEEIAATVQVAKMLATPRRARARLYPDSMHGLAALTYGTVALATRDTLGAAIEVLVDMPEQGGPRAALPLRELSTLGMELLIRKGLQEGWDDGFAASPAYRDYAAARADAGLA